MDTQHTDLAFHRRLADEFFRPRPQRKRPGIFWADILVMATLSVGVLVGVCGTEDAARPETGAPLQALPPSTSVALVSIGTSM